MRGRETSHRQPVPPSRGGIILALLLVLGLLALLARPVHALHPALELFRGGARGHPPEVLAEGVGVQDLRGGARDVHRAGRDAHDLGLQRSRPARGGEPERARSASGSSCTTPSTLACPPTGSPRPRTSWTASASWSEFGTRYHTIADSVKLGLAVGPRTEAPPCHARRGCLWMGRITTSIAALVGESRFSRTTPRPTPWSKSSAMSNGVMGSPSLRGV